VLPNFVDSPMALAVLGVHRQACSVKLPGRHVPVVRADQRFLGSRRQDVLADWL
jgi:hypothetical protein